MLAMVMAIALNWWLFAIPLYTYPACLNAGLVVLPLIYLRLPTRDGRVAITLLYAMLALWPAWEISRHAYSAH